MKARRLLAIFVCISLLFGCSKNEDGPHGGMGMYSNHYISSFSLATGLNLYQLSPGEDYEIWIHDQTEDLVHGDKQEALYQYFGDTSYNRYVSQDPTVTQCYADEFTALDVYSSADFGNIKAGESLADIVMFRGATAKPYIDGNYSLENVDIQDYTRLEQELGKYNFPYGLLRPENFYPICKRASELKPEEMILLSTYFMSIRFMETPEIKEHTITIVLRTKDKEVREQIDVVFP